MSVEGPITTFTPATTADIRQFWSTGPVEGEMNKLKMVKRAMFGRAGFSLLQRRILLAG